MKFFNRTNLSASVGNILEWYDFCLYGYFAPLLAKAFFPHDHPYLALLAVFLTFAVGYIMRPLGGVIFGLLGDQWGRGKALYLAMCIIAVPTFLVGVLPDYAQIGFFAPLCLVIVRLIQGISAGGQYSGSLAFLRNENGARLGARAASLAYLGSLSGYLVACGVGLVSIQLFGHHQLAWRLPFLTTIVFVPFLLFSKKALHKPSSNDHEPPHKTPLVLLFKYHKMITWKTIILACIGGIYYSSFFVFLLSFMNVFVGIPMEDALAVNFICLISSGFFIILFAKLSDSIGRKPLILYSSQALFLLIFPAIKLIETGHFGDALLGVWALTTANTAFMAACAVVYVEIFPSEVQFTGCALSYNIGAGIVGGLTPAFLTGLIHGFTPWGMIVFLGAVALFAFFFILFSIPETHPIGCVADEKPLP